MSVNKEISVLIIDDYQTMRGVIRNLLQQFGFHNTLEAGTTDEAAAMLQKNECGLIIFDWLTGPASGADFVQSLRNDDRLSKIPLIVICAETNREVADAMRQAGVADFMAKPFTEAMLKKKMTTVLGDF